MHLPSFPKHLAERTRVLRAGDANPAGEFVLYWMHHAMRDHENPALDAARFLATSLDLPLVVYSGLSGRHPHNNDRHVTFILESAREVHQSLDASGVRAAFFLPEDPGAPSPLPALVLRSAVSVFEDYPVPPFPRWSDQMAAGDGPPVVAVDGHCVVPMQQARKQFARAFQFRQAAQTDFFERVGDPWPEAEPVGHRFDGALDFEAVDWRRPVSELVAGCLIDHSVAPIPETPGGSRAGYRRWKAFREDGLRGYARKRNDAARDGVSRLSAYLHYGCVSPLRIAREAAATGGKGPEKYLDELFVWRELAHNYCYYSADPASLDGLPDWARKTLRAHEGDRDRSVAEEDLHRGTTGDPLWDLAQRSLLRNGELHNNVRMTWGKKLVEWARSPEDALRLLLRLNNRYALDGSDPNSFGGLLWCLGLFDRPFPPAKPVLGVLRPRSSKRHAERIDLDAYEARIVGLFPRPRVAVVGAGVSGLAAARTLQDNGCDVIVFDKGRRPGGRLASREIPFAFDHGAQYFTARDPWFHDQVRQWHDRKVVAPWSGRVAAYDGETWREASGDTTRWVAVPENNALAAHLASDLDIRTSTRIRTIERQGSIWHLASEDGATYQGFDAVLVALPAPQAAELTGRTFENIAMEPCWTVVQELGSAPDIEADGVFVNDGPLSWMARDHAKPGRPGGEVWVLQAGPEWSAAHLEEDRERVAAALTHAAARVAGGRWPDVHQAFVHRWRYARGGQEKGPLSLWDASARLGFAGDWWAGGRVEGAWKSGVDAAGRILRDPQFQQAGPVQEELFA